MTAPHHIRLGVTGHRKLTGMEELSERIREALATTIPGLVTGGASQSAPVTYTIITPLAEGADRLVAQEVLKLPNSNIEAVLPLTKDDYVESFSSEQSRRDFDELCGLSAKVVTLRKDRLTDDKLTRARRIAYEEAGRYVVDHCDVLVALWDGKPSRGRGGTAEIIEYAANSGRPIVVVFTVKPYVIKTDISRNIVGAD